MTGQVHRGVTCPVPPRSPSASSSPASSRTRRSPTRARSASRGRGRTCRCSPGCARRWNGTARSRGGGSGCAYAGAVAGEISIGATMEPIETMQLDQNGDVKSARLPALNQPGVGTVPGPDVIIGELIGLQQLTSGAVNGRVGISLGTDACNKGTDRRGLVCLAEQRPSLYSAESLPNEWRRRLTLSGSSNLASPGVSMRSQRHRQTPAALDAMV